MGMKLLAATLTLCSAAASAATVRTDLPAGGTYVFQSGGDHYEIRCTAEPATPAVVLRLCTCTTYYQYDHYVYRLSANALLSNGRNVETALAENIETLAECNQEKQQYPKVCD